MIGSRSTAPAPGVQRRRMAGAALLGVLFAVLAGTVAARHGAPVGPDLPLHRWALRHRQHTVTSMSVALTSTGTGVIAYLVASLAGAAGRADRASRLRGAALSAVALAAVAPEFGGQAQ